ncbi:MAG: pilus assembly protein N-terminal domain-containing protein [Pirellulales bacterium]|nr:pilus assembly protein N-terminal domain-containing protein [Pirellulales bacterium]
MPVQEFDKPALDENVRLLPKPSSIGARSLATLRPESTPAATQPPAAVHSRDIAAAAEALATVHAAEATTRAAAYEEPVLSLAERLALARRQRETKPSAVMQQSLPGGADRSRPPVQIVSYDRETSESLAEPERTPLLVSPAVEFSRGSAPAREPMSPPAELRGERMTFLQAQPLQAQPRVVHPAAASAATAAPAEEEPFAAEPPAARPLAAEPLASEPLLNGLQAAQPAPTGRDVTVNVTVGDSRLGPFEVIDHQDELTVVMRRSKLLRTQMDIYRTAVVDPSICDVVQFTPREVSIIGKGQGATHVTFWFNDAVQQPITYLIRVTPDPEVQQRREQQYDILEEVIAELFPESKVKLTTVADKLIVRGQARDVAEASQIMAVIRGQAVVGHGVREGQAAEPLAREQTSRPLPPSQIINMLRVPGVHQVALRVKIAELNRSAARGFGVDVNAAFDAGSGRLIVQSLLNQAAGSSASILGRFDDEQINFGIHYLEKHGVVRMLSEPTLVTLSGQPASFVAGGEFAVPTTVGVGGVGAVTTDFRAFGAIITFVPTVIDKDLIRLQVAPEFSQIDDDLSVGGTPGLNTRAVTTTVEMREGQTLAIAGLLDDSMKGSLQSDLPIVAKLFGKRDLTRNETELLILVTPELVHPMEPEAVPPLPGFDVTEPNNREFFLEGRIEGRPTHEYRSTVWPRLQRRYKAGGSAMISGPFGHGD